MSALIVLQLPSLNPIHVAPQRSLLKKAVECSIKNHCSKLLVLLRLGQPISNIDEHWEQLQSVLCSLYVAQLDSSYALKKPLFDCIVMFELWSGYNVGMDPELKTVFTTSRDMAGTHALNAERQKQDIQPLEIEILPETTPDTTDEQCSQAIPRNSQVFDRVAVGGTFDHLHAGHKILLTMTALLATRSVVVGVTDDSMLRSKKFREQIEPIDDRISKVRAFLETVRRGLAYEIVPISDPFGPTITDPTIQALVCSKETEAGGTAVNEERSKRAFTPLKLRIIDVISSDSASITAQDMGNLKISSTWIRQYLTQNEQQ